MKHLTFLILCMPVLGYGQLSQDKMKAFKVGQEGIALMDKGNYEEAVLKLQEGASYDTANYFYPYHIAYVYVRKNEPEKAIAAITEVLAKFDDAPEQCYQMLGNLYDEAGNTEKALEVYNTGIKKYPSSGRLYMEKGIVLAYRENETAEAIECWEKGIEKEPDYAGNYYWAAKQYCNSKERIWGILYGEIFLHMEHDTERAVEISAFIYDAYEESMKLESKTLTVTLSPENITGEFCSAVEKELSGNGREAFKKKKSVDMEGISRLRDLFIQSWFEKGLDKKFPNTVFDYQKQVAEAGHSEAYNFWLMKEGNKGSFLAWKGEHETQYKTFLSWLDTNKMQVNRHSRFFRRQY